ncbi:MAG: hypothetical protein ACLR44_06595 [Clostridia bacterium]
MKKIFKNIIICICIVYFILSLIYSIIYKGFYEESVAGYESSTSILSGEEKNSTTAEILEAQSVGRLQILDEIIAISVISIVIGIMIGLLKSIEENSVIKYIVIFVFGFLAYYMIFKTILILTNKNAYGVDFWSYLNIDVMTFVCILVSYVLIYLAGILGIFAVNKIKVNYLNKTLLNSERKEKKDIYIIIKRVIIGILVILVVSFIGNITRKSIILINYSKKINELSNCSNYYEKKVIKSKNSDESYDISTQELYCKNGVSMYVMSDARMDFYCNDNTKEYILYDSEKKEFKKLKNGNSIKGFYLNNSYFTDSNVKIWGNIVLSFSMKIYSEDVDNKHYYVFQNGNIKKYINKDTYLIEKEIVLNVDNVNDEIIISEYNFEFGNVTDDKVQKPNISDFKELENE